MMVINAINFAAHKHKGQVRRGTGLPYLLHTVIVMELIQKYKGCSQHIEELKCAAVLHDVLEDTECDYIELEREFGPFVAAIVLELTSDEERITQIGKNEYLMDKMVKMTKYGFILKLLDRYSNVMDGPSEKYVRHTITMMDYLMENRPDITDRQMGIMKEIKAYCENFLANPEENG